MFFRTVLLAFAFAVSVRGHGAITNVAGANGVTGAGFGIIASTPRDGSTPVPFEQDTSIIRDVEINTGRTGACGRTPAGGNNDVVTQLAAASQAGLPTTASDGSLSMTLHQVNADGAGKYTCEVSTDGGNSFSAATVTTQVPGILSLSTAKAEDFPLVAAVAAGTKCAAGPNGDACIMRCRNGALAGPFGGCVAFAMGNVTDAAATSSASTTSSATGAATDATASGGLSGLLSAIKNKLGRAEGAPTKRYINSRVAGQFSGYWL